MVSGIRFATVDDDGVLVRHSVDQVGNNLTAHLAWCVTHVEPAWVYGDGSVACWHELLVGWKPDGKHVLTRLIVAETPKDPE